jgi:hypothetical protein
MSRVYLFDSFLGRDAVESILALDPNDRGKGKAPQIHIADDFKSTTMSVSEPCKSGNPSRFHIYNIVEIIADAPYPTCGICKELFQVTNSPNHASMSANSSSRLPFGLRLPCPNEHAYCISCMSIYIISKLDPEENGCGNVDNMVFPIHCPECPNEKWADGIPGDVAVRILDENGMLLWVRSHSCIVLQTLIVIHKASPKTA